MAYVPQHVADVFVSYSHDDDYGWIERFQSDLYTVLSRKLRSRTRPKIFFDTKDLRAGRVFDAEIANTLEKTGFFLAMVTPRYNTSTYCRHEELAAFLRHNRPESGRLIQIRLDAASSIPVEKSLWVPFVSARGPLRPDSDEYQEALRRVCEPIASELDKLYAASKMVFLAWPNDPSLKEERARLEAEIESRGLRVYFQLVAEHESDARLREALQQSTTSVHFFADTPDGFATRQWEAALAVGKPCVLASRNPAEARRGPNGSPAPVYLNSGNPTAAIVRAVERIANIDNRDGRDTQRILGRPTVFLSYKTDEDKTLGFDLKKNVFKRQFDLIPAFGRDQYADTVARASLVVLCRERADREWFRDELNALNDAMESADCRDTGRVLRLPASDDVTGLDLLEDDEIVHSNDELRAALSRLVSAGA